MVAVIAISTLPYSDRRLPKVRDLSETPFGDHASVLHPQNKLLK